MRGCSLFRSKKKESINVIDKSFSIKDMVFLIVFSIFAMLFIYFFKYIDIEKINRLELSKDVYVSINGGKQEHGSTKDVFKKHKFKKDDNVTIRMVIPKDTFFPNPVITTNVPNSSVVFYLDGEKIYSIGEDKRVGEVVGKGCIKVPLFKAYKGKELKICIHVLDTKNINNIRKINMMNSYDADVYNIRSQMVNIHISNFVYVFGVICMLLMLRGFWKHCESKRILDISLISLFGSTWIIASTNIGVYLRIPLVVKYYAEYELLFVLVFFVIKLFYSRFKDVKERRFLKFLEYGYVACVIFLNCIRIFTNYYFSEFLIVFHIWVLVMSITYYYLSIRYRKKYKEMFVIFTAMFLAIMIYAVMYLQKVNMIINATNIIAMMIFVLGIYMFFAIITEIRISYMHNLERNVLLNKVYEDKLTSVNNRRSCEKYMKTLNKDKDGKYIVYSFDINNLKKLNDAYGHEKGDALIKAFASLLKEIFKDSTDFVGRMGGDEFLAVQKVEDGVSIGDCIRIAQIEEVVNNVNNMKKFDFDISFAVGYDVFDKDVKKDIWEIYNIADKMMYDVKSKMKEQATL